MAVKSVRLDKLEKLLANVKGIRISVKLHNDISEEEIGYYRNIKDEYLVLLKWE